MNIQMGINPTRHSTVCLYHDHVAIPSLVYMGKGWHALAGTADLDRNAWAKGALCPPPDR